LITLIVDARSRWPLSRSWGNEMSTVERPVYFFEVLLDRGAVKSRESG